MGTSLAVSTSATPGMDILDTYRCPAGQKKIQISRGVEDGFARAGHEPAIIRPEVLELPFYEYLYNEKNSIFTFRDFDELGIDKFLISSVDVPPKIAGGVFVIGMKSGGRVGTDLIRISDLLSLAPNSKTSVDFAVKISDVLSGETGELIDGIAVIDLKDFETNLSETNIRHFIDYIETSEKKATFDVVIHDDTRVDFFGISFCQNPLERHGTTMSVDSRGFGKDGVDVLQCNYDPNQRPCDPVLGDTLCTSAVPLGCYKDGNGPMPENPLFNPNFFIGGEVKATPPIIGETLSSITAADETCAENFGEGWRTLSYHESGGGNVIAYMNAVPHMRMWVDVKDNPSASCWRNGPQD